MFQTEDTKALEFEGIVRESEETDSLELVDEIEDEGISDISTHETIINPSNGNERYHWHHK